MIQRLGILQRYTGNKAQESMPELASSETGVPQSSESVDCNHFRVLNSSVPSHSQMYLADNDGILLERFHLLAVRLKCLRVQRELKKVLITSAVPEEGKSMIATNLATAMASNTKERIVLVEGDLRRPSIAVGIGCRPKAGLTQYLTGGVRASQIVYRVEPQHFYFVPAGTPVEDAVQLMQSGRLAELFDQLTKWFEWVIIDSTPILPIADTAIWTRLADGVVFVTREGKTEKRLLQKAWETLDHSCLLGVVVNGCSDTLQGKYSKYYNYYHSRPRTSKVCGKQD